METLVIALEDAVARLRPALQLPDVVFADWDMESYCCHDGCHQPATHERLADVLDDQFGDRDDFTPCYELVCCRHAVT